MFEELPRGHFRAILADPPWHFACRSSRMPTYETLQEHEIAALTIGEVAADDCVLFLWTCWPILEQALRIIAAWGFEYKTCGFCWTKAHAGQLEMFQEEIETWMGLGYWTRSNSEVCLLATRGSPKWQAADVRQALIEPARQHSRKPDCVYERIERLVAGPYLELFARTRRPGWTSWGNEADKFPQHPNDRLQSTWRLEQGAHYDANDDMSRSLEECYAAVRERKAQGGPGWP